MQNCHMWSQKTNSEPRKWWQLISRQRIRLFNIQKAHVLGKRVNTSDKNGQNRVISISQNKYATLSSLKKESVLHLLMRETQIKSGLWSLFHLSCCHGIINPCPLSGTQVWLSWLKADRREKIWSPPDTHLGAEGLHLASLPVNWLLYAKIGMLGAERWLRG